ncbi:hypothetical protein [Pseudothermotoga thermarum]|uniref:Uncharacterized protein n=1 Tax=Pseudothermotoga thermarum DSM 5069 TaxID=688269 RepID=F7YTN6_9THEM|nr:hypothetical protein [Pseudothermotoga thermarum]AEH51258.1 hypothetical protein Theth_1186 [Pseudothermotoga thermarum DSM 5069]
MVKPIYALSDEEYQRLKDLSGMDNEGRLPMMLEPLDFESDVEAYFKIFGVLAQTQQEVLVIGTAIIKNKKKQKTIKMLTRALIKPGCIVYKTPIVINEVDSIMKTMSENTDLEVYSNEDNYLGLMKGGSSVVSDFLKALSKFSEVTEDALNVLHLSVQELESLANLLPTERGYTIEVQNLRDEAQEAFKKIYGLIVKATELYVRMSKSMVEE